MIVNFLSLRVVDKEYVRFLFSVLTSLQQLNEVKAELNETKKKNATLQKKLDGLNSFVKRIGGSTDFMLKGSTSFFRKENQTLKTKVSHTCKNVSFR